jgi:L-aspartate oxidase
MKMSKGATWRYFDVIIAGAGIAGLYAALNISESKRVLVLAKEATYVCNSALAQGGVAAVLDEQNDCTEQHAADTLRAGGYENDLAALDALVNEGAENVMNLLSLGAVFDTDEDGKLCLALEGGHSRRRIAHSKDSTGKEITSALYSQVCRKSNITLLENAYLLELSRDGLFSFLVFMNKTAEYKTFFSPAAVLATGGIGRVYGRTTNSKTAAGDGIYLAHKLGAKISNIHYIQFHPTALSTNEDNCFLLSEALRGEGAVLLNCDKQPFMRNYEPERGDLAPRDVVSGCIMKEERRTGSKNFYLDISFKNSDFIKSEFPMIYAKLLEKGFDLTKEPVPVYPCQHYLMGGIAVNTYGETDIPGLYAVGECSCTGVHGRNRLASNSLLEALVFPKRVAQRINSSDATYRDYKIPSAKPVLGTEYFDNTEKIISRIQKIMQSAFFAEVNKPACEAGLRETEAIRAEIELPKFRLVPEFAEAKAIACVAYLILSELLK